MDNRFVSIYFRELREGQGFMQESLAEAAHCGKRTIERLERNEGTVGFLPLERIMATLGASRDEVNYLMSNPSATEADAREMARALLRRDPSQHWPAVHLSTVAPDADQLGVQTYVRTLRERQGLSRKEVADKLGVLIATYADWETGQSTAMAFPVLARLIRYVGGSLDDLQRIALAPEGHEALGLQLAQERLATLAPPQHASHAAQNGAASHIPDGHILLRLSITAWPTRSSAAGSTPKRRAGRSRECMSTMASAGGAGTARRCNACWASLCRSASASCWSTTSTAPCVSLNTSFNSKTNSTPGA